MKVAIKASEYYLPANKEDGGALKAENPDWRIDDIENKTGVRTRYIADADETATDLAAAAAEKLFATGVRREDVDFLILITQSPDYKLPTSACVLQDRLGLNKGCLAFDVNLGCSGFVYGLAIGGGLIEAGIARSGLVICSETYTKYIDKSDRTCRPIFSDGASASLISACKDERIGPFELGTDGSGFANLIVRSGGARETETAPQLCMDGSKVFMFTMSMVPKCVHALLDKAGKTADEIDLFVFHQASKIVIDNIIRVLELPQHKVFINYDKVGNTVSASLPMALRDAVADNRVKTGDQIMLVGFGVGYSWGACLVQWDAE